MNRKIFYWKLRTTELQLGERTLIMGVLNVTPDSFSDGGHFSDPDRAYARALEMQEQGVDIIDIGAESTRPDSKRISADEEWQRLVPVLKRLKDNLRVPLSLDTYKSETAERALEYGIEILNDPSGLTFDADLARVAVESNAGLILNHMRGLPETWARQSPMPDVMGNIGKDLEATVNRARRMGVEKNRIMIDPGLGFGKRKEQNSEILAQLTKLASLDAPILVGPSRKSFLAQATEGQTVYATAAAVAAAIMNGAHVVRVHDVREMRIVAQVADEIVRAGAAAEKPAQDTAERHTPKVQRKEPTAFLEEERHVPTRPPLARPVTPIAQPAPAAQPQRIEDRPIMRRPPQDRPSKGWEQDRPQRTSRPDGKPPFRGPSGTRPPRRDFDNRPPRRDSRDSRDDRPPFRGGQDRPPRNGPNNPSRGAAQGRPPQGRPSQDRPSQDRPSQGRPSQGRPSQDRPSQGRPAQGRPPQGGPPRRPFRKRP